MPCCGRGRSLQRPSQMVSSARARSPMSSPMAAGRPTLAPTAFEYTGPSAIAVTGLRTGATYRFAGKGARVSVHGADAPSLIGVPGLRPVR
jgi:hypothetical protein